MNSAPTVTQLTARYILALSMVALLSLAGQMLIQWELVRQTADAKLINLAGRQRMLSQRLTKDALKLAAFDETGRSSTLADLGKTLELWTRAHAGLQRGDIALNLPGKNSGAISALFAKIEPSFTAMQNAARALVAEAENGHLEHTARYVNAITSNEGSFLTLMDQIVTRYQAEAQAKVRRLKQIEMSLFGLTLLVLTLEGFLVFRPAVARVAETIAKLTRTQKELQSSWNDLESQVEQRTADLKLSESQFRTFFQMAAVGMAQVDPLSGRFVRVNPSLCQLLQYTPEDLLGKTFADITHPDERSADTVHFQRMVNKEIPVYDTEKRYIRKDGRCVWVHVTSSVLEDEHGRPQRTVSIIKDVTVRRAATEALKRSEEHFRTLAELIPQIVWTTDAEGRLEYCNHRWKETLGPPPQLGDKPVISAHVHPEDAERTSALWHSALLERAPFQIEHRLKTVSGEYHWYLDRALPMLDDRNNVVRWIGSCTDVHDQKLRQLKAQQSSRNKDEFVAMISHELRTPLTAILGWTALLRSGGLSPELIARGTDIIERNAKAQARLVNDLLDMSRIVAGKMKLERQSVLLEAVVESAIETIQPAAELKQIRVKFSRQPHALLVHGDESRLQQVFLNLLSNSIKFTPEKGQVEIRLAEEGGKIQVEVSDTGQGIPSELLPHIFERFRQGKLQPNAEKGLGLGLAIVKHLVELHGGTVSVTSAGAGKGACFRVRLPALSASRRMAVFSPS